MANSRDEIVRFVYEVIGDKETAAQVVALLKLSDAGQLADESINELAQSFKGYAAAANLADKAVGQKAGLTELAANADAAIVKLNELQAGFTGADIAAGNTSAEFKRAEAAVATLTAELAAEQLALLKTEGALQKAGVDTANLAVESTRLRTAAAETAAQLGAVSVSARQSAASIAQVAEQSPVLSRFVDQVKELAKAFLGLFVITKAKDAIEGILEEGDKAEKFQHQFTAAFGSIADGAEALKQTREIAEGVPIAFDDIAAAVLHAKKEGLDPFDGTLRALIDVNLKYGGSVETLNGLIDTLGKAFNKGQVDLRLLTSLQQQGIPAAQLLGDAMGKTAEEIREMAKAGQLGRDAVKTLIDALAQSGQGEAAAQLGTLTGLTTKLHDEWQEFLELIANSGAYQFVVQQLDAVNAAFKRGLADGSLAKTAQSISDAIVGIGRALAGMTSFVIENATAIGIAVKGYILFQVTLLALKLGEAAAGMLGLAEATKAAGAAAEAAAGADGASGLGKLGAVIGKLPKTIQIAIAIAAVDFAVTQLEHLVEVSQEFNAMQAEGKQIDADIATQRDQNLARAQIIADKLRGFADQAIASADTLAAKNKAQSDDYIEQLQNAIRFYTALRIQQEAQGDAAGVTASTEKLKALGVAVEGAKAHVKELTDALKEVAPAVTAAVNHFDEMVTAGEAAATAIAGAFKNIDVKTPAGLQAALDIIRQVSVRSAEAGRAVQSELLTALKDLDETDLRNFELAVTAKLDAAKGKAEELRIALGAALQQSLLNLGASAQQAGVDVTAAGEQMIATFEDVANNATASGKQIQLAFALALKNADTTGAVQQLEQQLTETFQAGKIGADEFAVAMKAAGQRTAEIDIAAQTASASLEGVGKEGQDAGSRLSGALQDARDQLIVLENALTGDLTAALSAGDEKMAASIRARIAEVTAEINTYNAKLQQISNTKLSPPDLGNTHDQFQQVNKDVDQYQSGVEGITFANKEAADAFEELGGSAGSTGNLLGALQNDYSRFAAVSSAAVAKFSATMKELFNGTGNFSVQALTDSTNIIKAGEAAAQASRIVQEQIDQQRQGVAALAQQYQDFASSASLATLGTSRNLDAMRASLEGDAAAARDGHSAFVLLGQADLSQLSAALDAAAQKVEQLKEQAQAAKDALEGLGQSIKDQIDELTGNQTDEEDRRFEKQLQDIKDQAKLAGTLNSAATQELIRQAELLHKLKLQQIAQEAAAQKQANQANQPGGTDTGGGPGAPGGGTSAGGGAGAPPGEPQRATGVNAIPINIVVHGSVIGGTPDQIAKQLAKLIKPELDAIQRRSV